MLKLTPINIRVIDCTGVPETNAEYGAREIEVRPLWKGWLLLMLAAIIFDVIVIVLGIGLWHLIKGRFGA